MPITNGAELRAAYLEYFKSKAHPIVASAPLIPPDDPTLMFTSAGMVQFKALYSGTVNPMPYTRAASCQKCLRAGGKGSDLENVGKTLRHHTFFEMLGNFSFGDYFKEEAINFAWEFITSKSWMNLPADRIFATIYGPTDAEIDTEAEAYWKALHLPNAIIPLDAKENFWGPAGETGACGPCSEIKFFMGSDEELREVQRIARRDMAGAREVGKRIVDEGDLFLEIWNLVFPQFDQQRDGSRPLLKNRGIDTGAGLERMTLALSKARGFDISSQYETDLLWPILSRTSEVLGVPYVRGGLLTPAAPILRRAADARGEIARMIGQGAQLTSGQLAQYLKSLHEEGRDHALAELESRRRVEVAEAKSQFEVERANQKHRDGVSRIESKFEEQAQHCTVFVEEIQAIGAYASLVNEMADRELKKANYTPFVDSLFSTFSITNGRLNAISDHARTLVFCLSEGITPSNVGRGYVVRRIIRRALRFAALLGIDRPFMSELYDGVVEAVGEAYPEIKQDPAFIRKALRAEEESFQKTIHRGQKLLDQLVASALASGANTIEGDEVFALWDTYGFPVDLTREVAEEAGVQVNLHQYEVARAQQKQNARASRKPTELGSSQILDQLFDEHGPTEFTGYVWHPHAQEAKVLAIIEDGRASEEAGAGDEVLLVLNRSPFYAESGGQVGDTGVLATPNARIEVTDTQKTPEGTILHRARVLVGALGPGESVEAVVDARRRQSIVRHHSAVHLLQNALKRIVGQHVTQAGSFVGPEYARFDFTHTEAVTAEQLRALQEAVNELILDDHEVVTEVMSLDDARRKGAIAPFGEKYGARVRVVTMGPSVEFCGGVHVAHTSQSGRFRIVSESSVASGVRRIEAVVGAPAVRTELAEQYELVAPLQVLLAAKGTEALERVKVFATRMRDLDKEVATLRRELAATRLGDAAARATTLADGTRLLSVRVDGFDGGELRGVAEQLRQKLGDEALCIVGGAFEGRVNLVVAVGKSAVSRHNAGKIVGALAAKLDGKGGGKPDMAQAGAKDVEKLDEVLAEAGRG